MTRETMTQKRRRAAHIIACLKQLYPDAHCALKHNDPLQLLIATILSAQCTDARVNQVTPVLFARFPDAESLSRADKRDIEQIIRSTGFFRAKAKSILTTAQQITAEFDGKIPETMENLTKLRGVGRKTANVVLGNAFGKNIGVVVDTHVGRLSRRMNLTGRTDPEKVERDLMKLIPVEEWTLFSHLMIFHGRKVCTARKPDCAACPLAGAHPSRSALCPRRGVAANR